MTSQVNGVVHLRTGVAHQEADVPAVTGSDVTNLFVPESKVADYGNAVDEKDSRVVVLPRDLFDFAGKFLRDCDDSDAESVILVCDEDICESDYNSADYEKCGEIRIPRARLEAGLLHRVNFVDRSVRQYFGYNTAEFIQLSFDFAVMVNVITKNRDQDVVYAAVYSFLRTRGVESIESSLLSFLVTPLLAKKNIVKLEAGEKIFDRDTSHNHVSRMISDIGDVMEYTFDSAFADALRNILLCGATLRWCSATTAMKIFTLFGTRPKGALYDIVRSAVKSLAVVVRVVEDLISGKERDIHSILFAKDRWAAAQTVFSTLNYQKDRIRHGIIKPNDGLFDRIEWLKSADELLRYLKNRLKNTSSVRPQYVTISNMVSSLETWISDVQAAAGAVYRRTPFGVNIFGQPGVGKSGIIDVTGACWCKVRGIKYSSELVYHRQKDSDFFDGLSNQIIGHWSEMGVAATQIARMQLDKMASELVSVIDSQPMMANQAELEKKGKKYISFECVISDTNNKTMGFQHSVMNPSAYLRRMFHVTVCVIPEVRKDGEVGVDWDKAKDYIERTKTHQMNIFQFRIERVQVVSVDQYAFQVLQVPESWIKSNEGSEVKESVTEAVEGIESSLSNQEKMLPTSALNIFQYCRVMQELMKAHIEKEDYMEKMRRSGTMFEVVDYLDESDYLNRPMTTELSKDSEGKVETIPASDGWMRRIFDGATKYFSKDMDVDTPLPDDKVEHRELSFKGLMDYFENMDYNDVEVCDEKDEFIAQAPIVACQASHEFELSREGDFEISSWALEEINRIDSLSPVWVIGRKVIIDDGVLTRERIAFVQNLLSGTNLRTYPSLLKSQHVISAAEVTPMLEGIDVQAKFVNVKYVSFGPLFKDKVTVSETLQYSAKSMMDVVKSFALTIPYTWYLVTENMSNAISGVFHSSVIIALWFVSGWFMSLIGILGWAFSSYFVGSLKSRGIWVSAYVRAKWRTALRNIGIDPTDNVLFCALFGSSMVTVALGIGAILMSMKPLWKSKTNLEAAVREKEMKYGCGPAPVRRSTNGMSEIYAVWDKRPRVDSLNNTPEELVDKIMQNVRHMKVDIGTNEYLTGFVTGICKDWCITTKHYFYGSGTHKVILCKARFGKVLYEKMELLLKDTDMFDVGEDLIAFRAPGVQFVDIRKHLYTGSVPKVGKATIGDISSEATYFKSSLVGELNGHTVKYTQYLRYLKATTGIGCCGLPVLFPNLVGLHCAGDDKYGYASFIDVDKLNKAISSSRILLEAASESYDTVMVADTIVRSPLLVQPHPKSPFSWNCFESIRFVGSDPYAVVSKDNYKMVSSIYAEEKDFVDKMYECLGEYPSQIYGTPMMKPTGKGANYINPYTNSLTKMNCPGVGLDLDILEKCVTVLVDRFVKGLNDRGIFSLSPLTQQEAINGSLNDDYLRRINASTAGGFGFPGPKQKYMPIDDEIEDEVTRTPVEKLQKLLDEILESFDKEEMVGFVYKASLKFEPREIEKCRKGKTRLFYASSLPCLILQRQFLGPFYTSMVAYADLFCSALGIPMHTRGHEIYEKMKQFSKLIMEGDYGGFDLKMPFLIGLAAASVVYRVLQRMGYNEQAMRVVLMLLNEELFPLIVLNGDFLRKSGIKPSGSYATAENNGIRNLLMLMYYWYSSDMKDKDFFDYNLPVTLGDDFINAVKEAARHVMNNVSYANFVLEKYGMECTNASKEDMDIEFVSVDTMSFLKRKWRYHKDLDRMVAVLNINSIYRMLTHRIPSKSVTDAEQTLATTNSALWELALHVDKNSHDTIREYFIQVFEKKYPSFEGRTKKELPDYNEIIERLRIDEAPEDLNGEVTLESGSEVERTVQEWERELKECSCDDVSLGDMTYEEARQLPLYHTSERYQRHIDKHFQNKSKAEAIRMAIRKVKGRVRLESGTEMSLGQATIESSHQNVVDIMGMEPDTADEKESLTFGIPSSLTPTDFFERPVKIAETAISFGVTSRFTYRPWNLLSLNPAIRAKLRNYALMRADMELTIEFSASPFHYGRIMATYIPLADSNEPLIEYENNSGGGLSGIFELMTQYLSQAPGTKIIDIRENKPLVMNIPYINYKPFVSLFNEGSNVPLGSGTAINDFYFLGKLFVTMMTPLQAANATSATSINMYIYARFKNVVLAASTASQLIVANEAGREMKTGPVERLTSTMADVADAVTTIPVIRPWAMATGMVLRGISGLSALFGWSVPRIDNTKDTPKLTHDQPYQNNVVTIGRSTAQKYAFDPMQEISVDPRVVGAEHDELSTDYISSTNSYYQQFDWESAAVPMETVLYSVPVTPVHNVPISVESNQIVQPTALAFSAIPFEYWSGDIEFTFDFVASMLHRGKVLIQFEPNVSQYLINTTSFSLNKQYSLILDLQEAQRITVRIPWMQHREWLRVNSPYSTTSIQNLTGFANGYLTITPFTRLASPDGSSVKCLVFVKGVDMRYNFFNDEKLPTSRVMLEAGVEFPEPVSVHVLGEQVLKYGSSASLVFGEQPKSFRSYLKRYFASAQANIDFPVVPGTDYEWTTEIYPDVRPCVGQVTTRSNLYSYLHYAYLAKSGSMRKRIFMPGYKAGVYNQVRGVIYPPGSSPSAFGGPSVGSIAVNQGRGIIAFVPMQQSGNEVEIPLYSLNFFIPAGYGAIANMIANYHDSNFSKWFSRGFTWSFNNTDNDGGYTLYEEASCAEDFTFRRWIAAPWFRIPA